MSTKYTTINVTQRDIDRALRKNSSKCVVATAIAGSVEGARRVSIDMQTVRFTVGDERFVYLTPPAAAGYVVAFDAGEPIHPFAFRLSEDHRVSVRSDRHTDASKERARARGAAKAAAAKAEKARAAAAATDDPLDRALAERAEEQAEAAAQADIETKERLDGQPHVEPDLTPDPDTGKRKRKPPPLAHKTVAREYGYRVLRINQADDDDREARRGVTAAYDVYADDPSA
jgi:hypothetical protein